MRGKNSTTIPCLPCVLLDETLDFWQTLGYEVTLKQRSPNAYAVIHYDDYDLHFFSLKQLNPQDNFSTCLVIVPEVEQLHHLFAERLHDHANPFGLLLQQRFASTFSLADPLFSAVLRAK